MTDNKSVIRDYVTAAAAQDWDKTDGFHAEGWRQVNPDGAEVDHSTYRDAVAAFFGGFPDLAPTIHDQIAEGDKVVTHLTWSGTHTGDFMGIPPTGKHADFDVIRIDRLAGGKIAHTKVMFDGGAALRQLGVM